MNKGCIYCEKPSGTSVFDCIGISFENVCAIPASFLNLDKKTSELVIDKYLFKDSKPFKRLTTLGDFATTTYKELYGYVFDKTKDESLTSKIMVEIQSELAKYALSLSRSTFTVYDIDINKLQLSPKASKYLSTRKYKTIGDLQLGYEKIVHELPDNKDAREIRASILKAMAEYCVFPEGAQNKLKIMLDSMKAGKPLASLKERRQMFFPLIAQNVKYKKAVTLQNYNWPTSESYKTAPCDYSSLVDYIKVGFKNIREFGDEIGVDPHATFHEIMNGKNLTSETLKKLGDYFNLNLQSMVKFNSGENIKNFNKSSQKNFKDYDYTPLLNKIRAEYGYYANFLKECNIHKKTMLRISRGEKIRMQSLKEICSVLHCKPEELYTKITKDEKEQKPQTECDYSQLFDIIKNKLLMSNVEFAERAGISLKTISSMSRGRYIGREKLEKIAAYLGTSVDKIVVINDPTVINVDLSNQSKLTSQKAKAKIDSAREIDYKPLLEKVKE